MYVPLWRRQHLKLRSPDGDGGGGGGASASDGGASGSQGAGDGGDGGGTDQGGGGGSGSDDGGGAEPTYEQLKTAADEATTKAEEFRRSKLTDDERKAEDDATAAAQVPEEYADFTMPDDMPVDEQLLADFKPVAKELGLSQGKAQQLIDLYATKVAPEMIKRQTDAWNAQTEAWREAATKDKEIGGDKLDQSSLDAQRVINTLGTPELKQALADYGFGNHPELVRIFSRMAVYLKEDSMAHGGATRQNTGSIASKLYPNLPE